MKAYMKKSTNKVLRMGVVPRKIAGAKASGMVPTHKEVIRRPLASAAGTKPSVSLSLFLEMYDLEIEHELVCTATCCWHKQLGWGSGKEEYMKEAWKRHGWEATSPKKVGGAAGTFFAI